MATALTRSSRVIADARPSANEKPTIVAQESMIVTTSTRPRRPISLVEARAIVPIVDPTPMTAMSSPRPVGPIANTSEAYTGIILFTAGRKVSGSSAVISTSTSTMGSLLTYRNPSVNWLNPDPRRPSL